jgi:pyruvate formate lyase activating enzyme
MRASHAVDWETDALAEHLLRDRQWWSSSGGGVTVSGGEPLLQASAVEQLLQTLGTLGVHRVIETAGAAPRHNLQQLVGQVDLWLFDVKSVDPDRFAEGTCGEASVSLDNLRWLIDATDATVRIRIPLINAFNADAEQIDRIARWIGELPRAVPVELLAGHERTKPNPLDRSAGRNPKVSPEQVADARSRLRKVQLQLL